MSAAAAHDVDAAVNMVQPFVMRLLLSTLLSMLMAVLLCVRLLALQCRHYTHAKQHLMNRPGLNSGILPK